MMKKIVPFNNVLEFNTDVKEITAISLEHEINKSPDMISGVFYITGEYKIAEGLLDREKFSFELPFDIALSNNYRQDSLLVDIDDFRYDLISDKSLKVNIDLYIDGEVEELTTDNSNDDSLDFFDREELEELEITEDLGLTEEFDEETVDTEDMYTKVQEELEHEEVPEEFEEESSNEFMQVEPERIDLLKEMLNNTEEETMDEELNVINNNENENNNIFEPNKEEKYVTYRVYKVEENDTIDTIITKYNVTKEMLADYNNIENITPGDKLIIPTNEK